MKLLKPKLMQALIVIPVLALSLSASAKQDSPVENSDQPPPVVQSENPEPSGLGGALDGGSSPGSDSNIQDQINDMLKSNRRMSCVELAGITEVQCVEKLSVRTNLTERQIEKICDTVYTQTLDECSRDI